MNKTLDVVGIGFGPANIALAALFDEEGLYSNHQFMERTAVPTWQKEMLFDNALDVHSNIQNIPHRDLATLRSPRSKYTFMNYLYETGLLLSHLNMDLLMPMRPDFAAYVRWVSDQVSQNLVTDCDVEQVSLQAQDGVPAYRVDMRNGDPVFARHVVIGVGREPYIPEVFANCQGSERVFHLTQYNSASQALRAKGAKKFAIIGSSQSAVEIVLHLSKVDPEAEVHSYIRRFAYPLKDTNPFMSEIYFPEFTDLYFQAGPDLKRRIDGDVYRTNYGSCDMDVLEELYRQQYYDRLHNRNKVHIHRMTEILSAEEVQDGVRLTSRNGETGDVTTETFDGVILATGFRNIGTGERSVQIPKIISGVAPALALDGTGCVQVDREYRAKLKPEHDGAGALVLNGLCENSHGMGDAGSVSLLALRAQTIADALLGMDGLSQTGETHAIAAQ
ncbi:MAG: SidA/IucD/PvdA family monooxygenase [Colwellia sp.]|nr:SidA/IucD/PvdA family monooxygenase [Colwellia sp.]